MLLFLDGLLGIDASPCPRGVSMLQVSPCPRDVSMPPVSSCRLHIPCPRGVTMIMCPHGRSGAFYVSWACIPCFTWTRSESPGSCAINSSIEGIVGSFLCPANAWASDPQAIKCVCMSLKCSRCVARETLCIQSCSHTCTVADAYHVAVTITSIAVLYVGQLST